ncbi:MAG: Abi family protein [Candidatus Faecisoma sp.]|nr:Abi family protein [Acholeplasma sp.]MDY2892810.1 Abi family protein [Candidatus Faecisoma sp.]
MKEFKTIDEQINLLKSRNISFDDETKAKDILLNNNYYNIINGYKDLFLDCNNPHNYKQGTKFEEIYALYDFDRQLRNIFLEYILKIENLLRSLVAYYFSQIHGNDNYLKLDNFENFSKTFVILEKKQKQIKFIQFLIGNINKNIAQNIDNKYISHYMTTYGFTPLWVLVNILSFGDICNFYKLMKQSERVAISKCFNIQEYDLTSLLNILCKTRNLCAHDERLYNYNFQAYTSINDTKYHSLLNLPKSNNRYIIGKNDLYAVVIALKLLLNEEDYKKFHNKLFSRIMSIQSKLNTITVNDVLNAMNFPSNWHDILKKS